MDEKNKNSNMAFCHTSLWRGVMRYLRTAVLWSSNVFTVAAAVFLQQNSKNGRASELYALKKKGFIYDQTVDVNKLHKNIKKIAE